jgi:hypothetical protein
MALARSDSEKTYAELNVKLRFLRHAASYPGPTHHVDSVAPRILSFLVATRLLDSTKTAIVVIA